MRLITLLVAFTLVFASCGSAPAPSEGSPASAPARQQGKGKAAPVPGQIPVEKRAVVKFQNGDVDEFTVSEYDPSDITLLGQNRFSASGGLMDQMEYSYDEDKNVLTTKMTKDEENRLKSRIVYEYNDAEQLYKESVANKAGKLVSSNVYTYNKDGNVASRAILNGANVKLAETVYTYQGNLVVKSETQSGDGRRISSSENDYDRDGNLVNQTLRNATGAVTRIISTVWQSGMEMESTQTSADGKLQLKITNEYGTSGELVKRTIENRQGGSFQIMEFEYEFRPASGRS